MVESKEILHLEDDLNCQPVEEYMQAGLFCTRQLMVSTIAKQYHRLISGSFVPSMEQLRNSARDIIENQHRLTHILYSTQVVYFRFSDGSVSPPESTY